MWTDQQTDTFAPVAQARRRYERVAEQILGAIGSGRLRPGDKLPSDRDLANRMGVSRPTVREALLALEFVGAIAVRAGDGVYVLDKAGQSGISAIARDFSLSPERLIEARIALEPNVAAFCATRMGSEDLSGLEALVDRTEDVSRDAQHLDEFLRLGLAFHSQLSAHCGNEFLSTFCCSLVDIGEHPLWGLVNRQAMQDIDARLGQVHEHRAILASIKGRDPKGASAAMAIHLERLQTVVFGPGTSSADGSEQRS